MKTTNPNQNELAVAWLAATETKTWEDFEAFASALNKECCRQIPRGRFNGVLEGVESEVRQKIYLILLVKFLITNRHLVGKEDMTDINHYVVTSISLHPFGFAPVTLSVLREVVEVEVK